MRILLISQFFWPENFRINDLAQNLVARGHDVTVFTGLPNYPEGSFYPGYSLLGPYRENYSGAKIIRSPLIPRGKGGNIDLALNYLSFAGMASLISPFVADHNYDAILVYQTSPITVAIPAILLKRMYDLPILMWVQDLWPESLTATGAMKANRAFRIADKLVSWIYDHCDVLLCQSQGFIRKISERGVGADKIEYFPNWAEDIYKPFIGNIDHAVAQDMIDGFRIVFAGNIGRAQSVQTIIAAAEKLKNEKEIKWIILGDGRKRSEAVDLVKSKGLNSTVFLPGSRTADLMPQYFSLADALLLTLRKRDIFSLTLPSKLQSYLACGKPVLAAIDGECSRIIREGQVGFACEAEDSTKLAENVMKLYRMSKNERKAMGIRSMEYYNSHFHREALISNLETIILKTTGK